MMIEFGFFEVAGLIITCALSVMLVRVRACQKVAKGTAHLTDGLTLDEYCSNLKVFTLWRKLRKFSHSQDVSEQVRNASKQAMRLEIVIYALMAIGLMILASGNPS